MSLFDEIFSAVARPVLLDGLADSVVHKPAGGSPNTFQGIVGQEGQTEERDEQGRRLRRELKVLVSNADAANVQINDVFTCRGEDWAVESLGAKSNNMTQAVLVRFERIEASRPNYRNR